MARATISLPVPVSPVISTGSGVAAMRRAVVRISDICSEAQMQSVIAVEGVGRPERGALLLVAAVAVERDRDGEQLPDRRERAVGLQFADRLDDQQPGLVGARAEGQVLDPVRRRRGRGGRLRRLPAGGVDDAAAGGAGRDQREPCGAAGALEQRDGFGAEDVGVPGQFEEGDGGVERSGRERV